MSFTEPLGYLAAGLVLAAFCMRDMARLRWLAIASNLAFIAYASLADLAPVLMLHLLLLPVNVQRLIAWRSSTPAVSEPRQPCKLGCTHHEQNEGVT